MELKILHLQNFVLFCSTRTIKYELKQIDLYNTLTINSYALFLFFLVLQ